MLIVTKNKVAPGFDLDFMMHLEGTELDQIDTFWRYF